MSAIEGHRAVAEGSVRVISDTERNARHALSLRPENERRALSTRFCRFGKIQSCGSQWLNRSFAVLIYTHHRALAFVPRARPVQ